MTHARLPAAPLRRVLLRLRDNESLTWEELADRAGITSRHLFRLLAARTISELVADRVSCRIGLHPALLWPKEWFRQEHPAEAAVHKPRKRSEPFHGDRRSLMPRRRFT
jgi:AraC-like DNA-binding protein